MAPKMLDRLRCDIWGLFWAYVLVWMQACFITVCDCVPCGMGTLEPWEPCFKILWVGVKSGRKILKFLEVKAILDAFWLIKDKQPVQISLVIICLQRLPCLTLPT